MVSTRLKCQPLGRRRAKDAGDEFGQFFTDFGFGGRARSDTKRRPTVSILRSWDIPRSKETDYAGVVLVVAELPGRGLVHGVTLPFTER